MTIADAFEAARNMDDDKLTDKIARELNERTNPGYRSVLLAAVAMGGAGNPSALFFIINAVFHAGMFYGESRAREELTNPFNELGEMPLSTSRCEDEWKKGVPGHPDNDMGM